MNDTPLIVKSPWGPNQAMATKLNKVREDLKEAEGRARDYESRFRVLVEKLIGQCDLAEKGVDLEQFFVGVDTAYVRHLIEKVSA